MSIKTTLDHIKEFFLFNIHESHTKGEAPEAISLLKEDHKEVTGLLDKVSNTTERAAKTRKELLTKIKSKLTLHEEIEEKYFYPALKKFEETRDLIFEALEEHELIDELITKLDDVGVTSEKWTARFAVLKENITHHVNEEEHDLFPRVKKVLDDEALKKIGQQMYDYKQDKLGSSVH